MKRSKSPVNHEAGNSRPALKVLATLAILGAAYIARPVLFPIVLALLMTLALRPVIRFVTNRTSIPEVVTSGLVVTSLLTLVTTFIFLLSGPASKWLEDAPNQFAEVERKMRPVKESVEEITEAAGQIEEIAETMEDPRTVKVEVARPTLSATVLSATSEFLLEGVIAVSCLFLFLAYGEDLLSRGTRLTGDNGKGQKIIDFFGAAEQTVSRYLLTFSLINAGLGSVIGLLLWIMGMPNPLLWGVMAACLNFVPYLGLMAGATIVFFVALVSFDSILYSAIAPAIYLGVNLIEANFVTPAILGRAMSVHVIILFLGIILLGWLWGIGGVLIAVPLMATMRVICEHVEALEPIARFLGDNEKPGSTGSTKIVLPTESSA